MKLTLSSDDRQFQEEVRDFLNDNLTPTLRRAGALMTSVFADFEAAMAWQRILHEKKGWAAPSWPEAFGGTGWSITRHYIYAVETAAADAPRLLPMGLDMCGPCLIGKGSTAQQQTYLPPMLSGDHFWCQGYSEPQSGSDLASLKLRAERDGDHYVLNGSKIWTTYAHHASHMFLLVRTRSDGKPQQGITFLLLDMKTPGLTVDPIISISGEHEQNQVFFEDVRVPVSNVVGQENDGWSVAKYLLEFERGGQAYSPRLHVSLQKVRHLASQGHAGERAIDDELFRLKLARAEVNVRAVEAAELKVMSALEGGQNPGAISSMLKIIGSEAAQHITELAVEALGPYNQVWQPAALDPKQAGDVTPVGPAGGVPVLSTYLNTRATTIYGGSNEIQRNIIAKMVLGL
ncbi:acyl-CoA dehydrogenase family protein [Alcanivorax sp. JB21]|uniref:acyl-CoA dehydrogenase family protein n=1 Tax=Alcanivorax limicola TaxID=2874102 RepID=UPI001CBD79DB|nr:acyl-CoA dehydrogenase family protein [Alcanivorax limicola]MBZ2189883.1 acyl-CoA dehydrogenase family protein [Alcanivorax limicola]